jgi:hypothetical protein
MTLDFMMMGVEGKKDVQAILAGIPWERQGVFSGEKGGKDEIFWANHRSKGCGISKMGCGFYRNPSCGGSPKKINASEGCMPW